MGLTKASGPNGFPTLFFQKFWHIMGRDVITFYLEILNKGKPLDCINKTNIVLIPKMHNRTSLKCFRPISLCIVSYKIISKTIAKKVQNVLDLCIDWARSAFVPGRMITNNVLLAYELLHTFKNKHMGKRGYLALKVDMSKVYDRVEWGYLLCIIRKSGFDSRLVELIMLCISSTSYSVCLNGEAGETFYPSRSLR